MNDSLLYPVQNNFRNEQLLNGWWKFQFDLESKVEQDEWMTKGGA